MKEEKLSTFSRRPSVLFSSPTVLLHCGACVYDNKLCMCIRGYLSHDRYKSECLKNKNPGISLQWCPFWKKYDMCPADTCLFCCRCSYVCWKFCHVLTTLAVTRARRAAGGRGGLHIFFPVFTGHIGLVLCLFLSRWYFYPDLYGQCLFSGISIEVRRRELFTINILVPLRDFSRNLLERWPLRLRNMIRCFCSKQS